MYGGGSMFLNSGEKNTIYSFLSSRTTYDVNLLLSNKSDSQIYNIYSRIKDALKKYPIDIIEYLNNHPEAKPRYTLEQLQNMSYNQLSNLREKFKIRKIKKVVGTTTPALSYNNALKNIKEKSISELCASQIKLNNQELILSSSEISIMYGDDWDSDFLKKQNIVLEDVAMSHPNRKSLEDIRLDKIDEIMSSHLSIKGQTPTFEELYSYDPKKLDKVYKLIKK